MHKCFPCIINTYLYSFSYHIRSLLGDIYWSSFFPAVPIRVFQFTMKIEQMGCITASLAQLVGSPKEQFIGATEERKAKAQSIKLYTAIGGYKSFLQMTPLYSPKRVHQRIALKCLKSQRHLKTNKQMDKQHFSFLVPPSPLNVFLPPLLQRRLDQNKQNHSIPCWWFFSTLFCAAPIYHYCLIIVYYSIILWLIFPFHPSICRF